MLCVRVGGKPDAEMAPQDMMDSISNVDDVLIGDGGHI
jgi:hypothetical protein